VRYSGKSLGKRCLSLRKPADTGRPEPYILVTSVQRQNRHGCLFWFSLPRDNIFKKLNRAWPLFLYGKFKVFVKEFTEIGKLALTIPAFLGDITPQNIKQALESTCQQDVNNWIDESIGQSSLSKRRKAFACNGIKLG